VITGYQLEMGGDGGGAGIGERAWGIGNYQRGAGEEKKRITSGERRGVAGDEGGRKREAQGEQDERWLGREV